MKDFINGFMASGWMNGLMGGYALIWIVGAMAVALIIFVIISQSKK